MDSTGQPYTGTNTLVTTTIIDDENPPETVLWSDNLQTDTSANYILQFGSEDGLSDYTTTFAFDYSNYSVPAAPHSGSDTHGLLLNVNKTDSSAAAAGLNLYPAGQSFSGNYALRFDMYLFQGLTATTEYSIFGINHDGAHTNWFRGNSYGYTNSTYDGVWASVESDGTHSAPADYALLTGPTVTNSTILGPSFRATASASSFLQVFKNPPFSSTDGGAPANLNGSATPVWADVELAQVGSLVTLRINHTTILQYNNAVAATSGNIMLGYDDAWDSIGNSLGVIYANARVVQLFPPTIVTQPHDTMTPTGGSTNMTVVASGTTTGVTNYQWYLKGIAIPGATNATLPLNNVQFTNYGVYTVVVSDGVYSVTSSGATLMVVPPSLAMGSGTGLAAGYWTLHTNTAPFTGPPTVTRVDTNINFEWGLGSPDPLVSTDYFTVRWAGQIQALSTNTDTYTFWTTNDDGVRLWVNGQLLIDAWTNQQTWHANTIALTGTNKYDLVMEYFDATQIALAKLYLVECHYGRVLARAQVPALSGSFTGAGGHADRAGQRRQLPRAGKYQPHRECDDQ